VKKVTTMVALLNCISQAGTVGSEAFAVGPKIVTQTKLLAMSNGAIKQVS